MDVGAGAEGAAAGAGGAYFEAVIEAEGVGGCGDVPLELEVVWGVVPVGFWAAVDEMGALVWTVMGAMLRSHRLPGRLQDGRC